MKRPIDDAPAWLRVVFTGIWVISFLGILTCKVHSG